MTLRHLHLSKHERAAVKLLLEIRKRLASGRAEEALVLVQAALDAYHAPRPARGGQPQAAQPVRRRGVKTAVP